MSSPHSKQKVVCLLLMAGLSPWVLQAQQDEAPSFTTDRVFNGASYTPGRFAPDSWAAVFGLNLKVGNTAVVAENGFPPELDGTMVAVTDSAGVTRAGGLRYVARGALSFLAPSEMVSGPATVTITNATGLSGSAEVIIDPVAPGLFAANEVGQGPVVANYLRVMEDGSRVEGLSFVTNAIAGTRSNLPIQFGAEGNDVYLSFWGTGFRHGASTVVRIGDVDVPVLASVAHSQFPGLDQAVVGPLPRELADTGLVEVDVVTDGTAARPVTLAFFETPGPETTVGYEIHAPIGAVERLIIRRNTLQWVHVSSAPANEEEEPPDFVTSIRTSFGRNDAISASWRPQWSGRVPMTPGEESSIFSELWPPLPDREVVVTLTRSRRFDDEKNPLPPRGAVTVVEAPSAANDYTLILEFDDSEMPDFGALDVRVDLGTVE